MTTATQPRTPRFQAFSARAVEAFLGIANPEGGRPTFCASESEAIEFTDRAPGDGNGGSPPSKPAVAGRSAGELLDACEDDADTIVDQVAQLCGWSP